MNKFKKYTGLVVFLITQTTYSQSTFEKAFGTVESEYIHSTMLTNGAGFISAGQKTYLSNLNYFKGYLLKTSATGNLMWSKNYTIGDHGGYFQHAIQTSDGGFIAVGVECDSLGEYDSNLLIVKTDAVGGVSWAKKFGGNASESGHHVIQTSDGGYLVLGETLITGSPGIVDVYVVRTDASGNLLWTKTYGGSDYEKSTAIGETSDGGFFITGFTYSFGSTDGDAYLVRCDSLGNVLWSKTYGNTGYDGAMDGILTSDGGYMMTLKTTSYGPEEKINLIKTNSLGDTIWTRTYHKPSTNFLQFSSIIQTVDLNYVVAGSWAFISTSAGYLFKVNNSGNCIWYNNYTSISGEYFYSVTKTPDNGLVITSVDANYWGVGWNDALLVKTDFTGTRGCYENPELPVIGNSNPIVTSVITLVDSLNISDNVLVTVANDNNIQTNVCTNLDNIYESEGEAEPVVFPNPAIDFLNIQNLSGNTNMKIYDASGRILMEGACNSNDQIDISMLSPGVYTIVLDNIKGNYYSKFIITSK